MLLGSGGERGMSERDGKGGTVCEGLLGHSLAEAQE